MPPHVIAPPPPSTACAEQICGQVQVSEVVATAYIPFVPFDTKRLLFVNAVEVARPFQVRVRLVVKSPPPPNGKLVVIETALDAGVNPKRDDDATW